MKVPVAAVSLDAHHTLLFAPQLARRYAEVLARHGIGAAEDDLERLIPLVWQEIGCTVELGEDRFGASPGGAEGFWRRFLERVCEHLGGPRPSPFAAAELFARFARADAWSLFPEVPDALDALVAAGLRLAVVSNFDHRLPGILSGLGIAERFEAVITSSAVGVEKPHPAIFHRLLSRLQLPAEAVVHVGDSRREDVEGALAVGMAALRIDRAGGGDLATLAEIPGCLRPVVLQP